MPNLLRPLAVLACAALPLAARADVGAADAPASPVNRAEKLQATARDPGSPPPLLLAALAQAEGLAERPRQAQLAASVLEALAQNPASPPQLLAALAHREAYPLDVLLRSRPGLPKPEAAAVAARLAAADARQRLLAQPGPAAPGPRVGRLPPHDDAFCIYNDRAGRLVLAVVGDQAVLALDGQQVALWQGWLGKAQRLEGRGVSARLKMGQTRGTLRVTRGQGVTELRVQGGCDL